MRRLIVQNAIVQNAQKFLKMLKIFVHFAGAFPLVAPRNSIIPYSANFVNRQIAQTFKKIFSRICAKQRKFFQQVAQLPPAFFVNPYKLFSVLHKLTIKSLVILPIEICFWI